MSKYEVSNNNVNNQKINDILISGENIIWQGKPKKSAFIINKVLTMLPIAIIWLMLDLIFIINFLRTETKMLWFIIPFFALHLMPVWLWLSNVLTANKRWKNTEYAVTDKRLIIISGFIGMDYQSVYYKDITDVKLKITAIDKILNVGDIYFINKTSIPVDNKNVAAPIAFLDIEEAYKIYSKIQKVVLDIQTDIEYPNNLRPGENDGYNTKYNSKF